MPLMDGKAGLVTGAASGIGRASAQIFAAEGASVVVADIDDAGGAETVELVRAAGGEASYLHCDVTSEADHIALVDAVVERYGRLDWAHNNAGVSAPVAPIVEQLPEWWDRILQIDLVGVMYALKVQIARFIEQGGGGAIVNTASASGLQGQPGMSQYAAAKWGVIGLTQTAALEAAPHGIRVNAICPGMTATPGVQAWADSVPEMAAAVTASLPLGRLAQPADQGNAAMWLCSDRASYITGVALPVDGGMRAG